MRKQLRFVLLLLVMLLTVTTALADTWCVYTENGKPLNVRVKPNKNSNLVTKISVGTEVDVMEITEDGAWAHISFGNRTGYCMLSYLQQGSMRFNKALGYTLFYDAENFTLTSDGKMDTFMWNGNTEGLPPCYLNISTVSGMKAKDVMDGLLLQSGADVDEDDVNETELGGKEALSFTYVAGTDEGARITQYVCCQLNTKNVMLAECGLYVGAEDNPGAYLRDMMGSMVLSAPASSSSSSNASSHSSSSGKKNETEYVQCDICGGWFEAGNIFRNHQCISYPAEDNMVRCDICGGWFEAGNIFRNHQCISYPAEDNMVRCDICGGWFEAGNIFRNHQCISYPAE